VNMLQRTKERTDIEGNFTSAGFVSVVHISPQAWVFVCVCNYVNHAEWRCGSIISAKTTNSFRERISSI
jgi:hypothetical protein